MVHRLPEVTGLVLLHSSLALEVVLLGTGMAVVVQNHSTHLLMVHPEAAVVAVVVAADQFVAAEMDNGVMANTLLDQQTPVWNVSFLV